MGVTTTKTNKPLNPRGNDQSPLAFNRAKLYSGKALDFDGVNDSIDISNFSLNGYTAFSVCFHKTDDFNNGMIFSSADTISDGVNIYQISPGYFRARLNGVNAVDTTLKVSDIDGFFVFTYDGTNAKWYYQAQNIDSGTTSQTFSIANTTSTIGRQSFASVQYLSGQIAGFKIFNTDLTAAQVADLYNNPEKIVPTGVDNTALKLWLPMMEGAGTTAYDGSGNGNHGTISGATYVNGIGAPVAQTAVMDWNKGVNDFVYSEDFSQTEWNQIFAGTGSYPSVSSNYATAPDGTQTADRVQFDKGSGTTNLDYSLLRQTDLISAIRTYAVWMKSTDGSSTYDVALRSDNFESVEVTGEWQRFDLTSNTAQVYVQIGLRGTWSTSQTADILIWGASAEQSATAGPYVRTGATAQTTPVLLPQGLTTGRDITGVNLFENVRKQGALNLDGNSWAEVHDNASVDVSEFTLEGWVYVDVSESYRGALISKYKFSQGARAYAIERNGVNIMFTISSDGSQTATLSSGAITSTGWHHFVATLSSTHMKVYVNGVEDGIYGYTSGIYVQSYPVTIGVLDSDSQSTSIMKDQIAQPRIYNRALTAEEVQRSYDSNKNIYTNS
jgi:hypothetical protein